MSETETYTEEYLKMYNDPNKLTQKQEELVYACIKFGNKSRAYRHVYNIGDEVDGRECYKRCQLTLDIPKVEKFFERTQKEMLENAKKDAQITVNTILEELEEARQLALNTQKASSAIMASLGKAKLLGFDRQVIDHMSSDGSFGSPSVVRLVGPSTNSGNIKTPNLQQISKEFTEELYQGETPVDAENCVEGETS